MIVNDCLEFIRFFGVTHYVSSISLGASEHTVLTESQYSRIVNEKASVSVAQIGSATQKLTSTSKSSKSSTNVRCLGKIVDNKVERGTSDEAVVGIKILPIHSLINHNHSLFQAMYNALIEYSEIKAIKPSELVYIIITFP